MENTGTSKAPEAGARLLPRVRAMALLAVFAVGAFRLMLPVWQLHTDQIFGDSFTYISFAQQLARGHFFWDHPLASIMEVQPGPGRVVDGPVWNISIRADGKSMFSVAIGYPAFLALCIKGGGVWLLTHANLLLLTCVMILLALVVWMALERAPTALALGCATALCVPFLDPSTFRQFSYPWREPLSYALVLTAVALALQWRRRPRGFALVGMAWFLGCACAVKEANVIYAPCIVLVAMARAGPESWRRRALLLAGIAAGFLAGAAPLLIQNTVSTGNPLISIQGLREATQFTDTGRGPGLRIGNLALTFRGYLVAYRDYPLIRWFLAPALVGGFLSARVLAGRLFLGLFISHASLYFFWGMDLRHMHFALLPYAFFSLYAIWSALMFAVSKFPLPIRRHLTEILRLLLVAVPALWPGPWQGGGGLPSRAVATGRVGPIIQELETAIPSNALVLVNRPLRDYWALHGRLPVARLHDMQRVGSFTHYAETLDALRDQGWTIVFVDATDGDPRNRGMIDWSRVDQEWLLDCHDLLPLHAISSPTPALGLMTARPSLTAYLVQPWSKGKVSLNLATPADGLAFAAVHPRSAGSDLVATLGGEQLRNLTAGYLPWGAGPSAAQLDLTISRVSGKPVPLQPAVRLVGWRSPIRQETHSFANPPDISWFPDGIAGQQGNRVFRSFDRSFRLRLPVRQGRDFFSLAVLQTGAVNGSPSVFRVRQESSADSSLPIRWGNPIFPVITPDPSPAHLAEVLISPVPPAGVDLYGIQMHTAFRRLASPVPAGTELVCIAGGLAPDRAGDGPHSWRVEINGKEALSGLCGADPFAPAQYLSLPVPAGSLQGKVDVEFHRVGLVTPVIGFSGPVLDVRMDHDTRAFCDGGFLPPHRLAGSLLSWTRPKASVRVPLSHGVRSYRVRLFAADGSSMEGRTLHIRFGGQLREAVLHRNLREYIVDFEAETWQGGFGVLELTIEPWTPPVLIEAGAPNALGFRFHRLIWQPVR